MASAVATGAESAQRELFADLSIKCDQLFALRDRLDGDFSVADRGYAQLRAITDEYDRAVISDQIASSALAIAENILEARLHQERLVERIGTDGIAFPTQETAKSGIRKGTEIDIDIAGWGRGLCSALDCLAACAIGILRIPLSIQRAQLSNLNSVPSLMSKATPAQRKAWQYLLDLTDRHRHNYPQGWFEWLNGMRVLTVHRARQLRVLLQRNAPPGTPQLAIVAQDPAAEMKATAKFDLHLRQRPNLSDMQDLIEAPRAEDIWISEPAQTTLPGVFLPTNELIEETAEYLLGEWNTIEAQPGDFPPPLGKWKPDRNVSPGFTGVTGVTGGFRPASTQLHTHPTLATRLALAEQLATTVGSRRPGARKQ